MLPPDALVFGGLAAARGIDPALPDDQVFDLEKFYRSAADCSDTQLIALIKHFKTLGFKPPERKRGPAPADSSHARKIRALWLSLYHLGVIQESSEQALTAFVKRQVGVDHMRFLRPAEAHRVIEALKSWAARPVARGGGGVDWENANTGGAQKCRVIVAQYRLLDDLGVPAAGAIPDTLTEVDATIAALGRRIRIAKAERDQ